MFKIQVIHYEAEQKIRPKNYQLPSLYGAHSFYFSPIPNTLIKDSIGEEGAFLGQRSRSRFWAWSNKNSCPFHAQVYEYDCPKEEVIDRVRSQ